MDALLKKDATCPLIPVGAEIGLALNELRTEAIVRRDQRKDGSP